MKNSKLTIALIVLVCVLVLVLAIVLIVSMNDRKTEESYRDLMTRADARYEQGELEEARALYEEGTELDPTRSRAWWGLANIYYVQGDVGTAVEVLYEASRQISDEAEREEMIQSMDDMEDTLRYDENNPPPEPAPEQNEASRPDAPEPDTTGGTAPNPDDDGGLATPGEEDGGDDLPEEDPEEPEEEPADITGISVNTTLLDHVLSMKHSQLVETYGVAAAAVTDWGVMVLYQRCAVNFFYGYSYDGLVDTSTCIPYDNSFPTAAAFGPAAALISGQDTTTLSMAQLELLFGTTAACTYNDMDGVWNVSVPYGRTELVFSSDAEGNADLNDLIWIYL